jgi:predicted metal-binding protein
LVNPFAEKRYVVIVQCHLVAERCPGYYCERAFHQRVGGFANYPPNLPNRTLYLTCGGCCGRALQRKLSLLARTLQKKEQIEKPQIAVQLASCITNDNYHGPPCPHLDYLKTLIARLGLEAFEGTHISPTTEERRREGRYAPYMPPGG